MERIGERLKWCRKRHGLTQRGLSTTAGVGLATIRRIEQDEFMPRFETVKRLAEFLSVNAGWLAFGDGPMVSFPHMTEEEQHRIHNGPGSAGLPGYVITGPGPWYRCSDEWLIDKGFTSREESGS